MKHSRNRWTALVLAAALIAPATLAANTATTTTATYNVAANAGQASELLREVRILAQEVSRSTDTLAVSLNGNGLHWMSHASYLNQAKDGINQIGARLETLQEIRDSVHPWQQEAIDRIHAASLTAAQHTESAIRYLNDNQGWLLAPSYKEDVSAIQAHAASVQNTADGFLDYAQTKNQLGTLQQRLMFE